MAVTDADRLHLLNQAKTTFGAEAAMTLDELLPPHDDAFVRRSDLRGLATTADVEALGTRIDNLQLATRSDIERLDARADAMDRRLDTIDGRLDTIDGRLDTIDVSLAGLRNGAELMEQRLLLEIARSSASSSRAMVATVVSTALANVVVVLMVIQILRP